MISTIERDGDTYVARHATGIAWTVRVELDTRGTPFREQVVWPAAGVVAIGGGDTVHLLSAESGALVKKLSLGRDLFGHFGPTEGDVLYVLGWRDVVAVDKTLAVNWISEGVAVDGITWRNQVGDRIQLSAEMDPPGGWVDVELDARTGRVVPSEERSR